MKINYWLKISISLFLISFLFSIDLIEKFLYGLSFINKIDIYLTLASINGVFFSIFFSIVLVAVQHSATNYLPSILKTFKRDKRLIFIVIVSLLSILVNLFFYLSEVTTLFFLSLLIFLISFLSIIFYFYEMLNFLSPLFLVNNLKDEIIKKMGKIKDKTIKQTQKEIKGTFLEKFSPFVKEAKLNSRDYQNKNIEEINRLFNHIERSNAINDFETYKKSLESLSQIVNYYFSTKEIDAQNDEFISFVLTKLKLQADFLIIKNEHYKVIEIIKALESMAIGSTEYLSVMPTQRFNFITTLISDYLKEIGRKSILSGNLDLAKECIHSLKRAGIKSIDKNLNLSMIEYKIKEISAISDDWFIYNNTIASINTLLCKLLDDMLKRESSKKIIPEFEIDRLIEIQTELLINSIKRYKGSLGTDTSTSPFFGFLSEVRLSKIVGRIIKMSQSPPAELATHNYEKLAKRTIKNIFENQEKVIKIAKENNANITLVNYVNEFLEIFKFINKIKLKTYNEGFIEEIKLLKELIISCYKDKHTLNMLKTTIKSYNESLEYNNKKSNKKLIEEINKILKELDKKK
jgi:hypothetical protein